MLKRILAGTMGVSMILTSLAADSFNRLNAVKHDMTEENVTDNKTTELEVQGSNSLGRMIANTSQNNEETSIVPLNNTTDEGEYSVIDVDFDIETGRISVRSSQSFACRLLVSFIDENDKSNHIDRNLQPQIGDFVITEEYVDTQLLPEFFIVKATLVDIDGKELCESQMCKKYTYLYQEAFKASVSDFDEELVVNLDQNDDTNFFVLNEDTIIVESNDTVNTLINADFDKDEFTFDNINESISDLKKGDIFFAMPDECNIIAVNVEDVVIDGENATIVGDGQSDNIFDFVKIETTEDRSRSFEIQDTDKIPAEIGGISDEAFLLRPERLPEIMADEIDCEVDYEGVFSSDKKTKEFKMNESDNYDVSGSVTIDRPIVNTCYYKVRAMSMLEIDVVYSVTIQAKGSASTRIEHPLFVASLKTIIPGLDVYLCPILFIDADDSFEVKVSMKPHCIYDYDSKLGYTCSTVLESINKSKAIDLDLKGKVYGIGLDLKMNQSYVSGLIYNATIDLIGGVNLNIVDMEYEAYMGDLKNVKILTGSEYSAISGDCIHECGDKCLHYNVEPFVQGAASISALLSTVNFDKKIRNSVNLGLAHYSWKYKPEFLWGKCQNMLYKTIITIPPSTIEIDKIMIDSQEVTLDDSNQITAFCAPGVSHKCDFYDKKGGIIRSKTFDVGRKKTVITIDPDDASSASNTLPVEAKTTTKAEVPTFPATTTITTDEAQAMRQRVANGALGITSDQNSNTGSYTLKEIKTATDETDYKLVLDSAAPENAIYYDIFADGTLHIYGYGEMKDFDAGHIPFEKYKDIIKEVYIENIDPANGLVITKIGNYLCKGLKNAKLVVIPDTITSIGEYAFSDCNNLITITYKNPYETIKEADGTERVVLREVFELPESIQRIEGHTFEGCSSLAIGDYKTGENLSYIGYSSFTGCQHIESAYITGNVKKIDKYAFSDCFNLKNIYMEKGVESIGNWLLSRCISLEKVTLPFASLEATELKNTYNSNTIFITLFDNTTKSSYVQDSGISQEEIDAGLCTSKMPGTSNNPNRYIPKSLTTIEILGGDIIPLYEFFDLSNVKQIIIPEEIRIIGAYAFSNCESIDFNELVIGDNVKEIGGRAFSNCKGIKSVVIPETVEEIGVEAFKNCTELKTAVINCTFSADSACVRIFEGCNAFEELTLPYAARSEKELQIDDFSLSKQLSNLFCEKGSDDTYYVPFNGSTRDGYYVPKSLKTIRINGGSCIPNIAFYGLKSVETVYIPITVTSIGQKSFYGCENLAKIYYEGTKVQWDEKVKDNIASGNDIVNECYKEENGRKIVYLGGDSTVPGDIVYGDINGDGKVTLADALAVLQFIANEDKYPLTEAGIEAADVYNHGDGITAMDAVTIQMVDTGLIDQSMLPVSATDLN